MTSRDAPASSAFSTSSFTTLDGRSTTSPAAIWFARSSLSLRMRPIRPSALGDLLLRGVEELARALACQREDDEPARDRPHDEPRRIEDVEHRAIDDAR